MRPPARVYSVWCTLHETEKRFELRFLKMFSRHYQKKKKIIIHDYRRVNESYETVRNKIVDRIFPLKNHSSKQRIRIKPVRTLQNMYSFSGHAFCPAYSSLILFFSAPRRVFPRRRDIKTKTVELQYCYSSILR